MGRLELVGMLIIGLTMIGSGVLLYRYGEKALPIAIAVVLGDLVVASILTIV